ncbi:MAG: hypothetical protein ACREVA_11475 [Burkholderiales bacterium]
MHWRASTKGSDQLGIAGQVRTFAKQHYEKPMPAGRTIVMERQMSWAACSRKKTQKLWIWKAMDSDSGELLDWEGRQ